jgi:hypothetical protein
MAFRLHFAGTEERVARRGRIAVVLTLTLFTVAFSAGRRMHHRERRPTQHGLRVVAVQPLPGDDAIVDAFGNEVTEAVATYKIDSSGDLYEEHSPQTEVPRLGSPKT